MQKRRLRVKRHAQATISPHSAVHRVFVGERRSPAALPHCALGCIVHMLSAWCVSQTPALRRRDAASFVDTIVCQDLAQWHD
eukprot:7105525-Lingulodinium_polyedra.AAC.1